MRPLIVFLKKEWLETVRTGKFIILILLFIFFGIMNPAIAKLTPQLMEMFADTLSENGLIITEIHVDAMTSWTQFFKNIPIVFIAFVLMYSDIFTKEYQSGTLLLILTKGLSRYNVVLAKTILMLGFWTVCYWLSFVITYGYNAYFWDNSVASNLLHTIILWWLFGVWIISLIVLFSTLLQNNTGVTICIGGTVLLTYLISMIPRVKAFTPMWLLSTGSLLAGAERMDTYLKAVIVTAILSVLCIALSIPIINRKRV